MNKCLIDGCFTNGKIRKGFCGKHYTRNLRYGDPLRERPTLADRFHSKYDIIPETGCWIWNGALCSKGYGAIQLGVKNTGKAHRVSWELHFGEISKGLFVCHKCDTPACVNPSHLFLGDQFENSKDMVFKNRSLKRTRNPNCKLTEADVSNILSSKETAIVIAEKLKVNPATIRRIRRNENWKDSKRMTFS